MRLFVSAKSVLVGEGAGVEGPTFLAVFPLNLDPPFANRFRDDASDATIRFGPADVVDDTAHIEVIQQPTLEPGSGFALAVIRQQVEPVARLDVNLERTSPRQVRQRRVLRELGDARFGDDD